MIPGPSPRTTGSQAAARAPDTAPAASPPAAPSPPPPRAEPLHRRHDLVWLASGADVAGPWVVAATPADRLAAGQLRLGRCLEAAPAAGRPLRRSCTVASWSVLQHRPPMTPAEVLGALPALAPAWRRTLQSALQWAAGPRIAVGVFGSLSWQALQPAATGFVHAGSNLDLLLEPAEPLAPARCLWLLQGLDRLSDASLAAGGPRIDGELRLPAGDVRWREAADALSGRTEQVLVRRHGQPWLLPAAALLQWPARTTAAASPDRLDNLARAALVAEACSWPKPGLVSPVDRGSHADMDIHLLLAAIRALTGSFAAMARAGLAGAGFSHLAAIGRGAEARMFAATGGVNAYRGAIFHLGLLVAAAAVAPPGVAPTAWVREAWGADLRRHQLSTPTHGAAVWRLAGAGGAIAEAAGGFPTVTRVMLPALQAAERRGFDAERARIAALLSGMAVLEDTNLLWRGGRAGLAWARAEARACLARDDIGAPDWRARLAALHAGFVARRLSPGGSADLLACACFLSSLEVRDTGRQERLQATP